nr:MAG TPA: hypothetical protein [Caudoviricetes sp.]
MILFRYKKPRQIGRAWGIDLFFFDILSRSYALIGW